MPNSNSGSSTVWLLPSHPDEGWASMNRYRNALEASIASAEDSGFVFRCPLERAEICTTRAGRLKLAITKQISYPLQVRRGVKQGIAHVLDHSYAYLLRSVPRRVKKIVTVHDLLPLREPEGLGPGAISRFRQRVEWVKAADLILSDSEATKADLVELIGVDPSMVRVLPLGVDTPRPSLRNDFPAAGNVPFLFSIGTTMRRKNLVLLPKVLAVVRKFHPEIRLIRAGEHLDPLLAAEFDRLCGPDSLMELGRVTEQQLADLYAGAAVTIIPSRYEGFGLPVLEAMAQGCPVVAANATSLPEVGSDAALYFEVDDADEAAAKVLSLLDDPGKRRHIIQRSLHRAGELSWDRHFQQLVEIYRELQKSTS